ncbi:glycoside hydrolase family 28 protein [Amaricoccus sp.]|uniref:polygalacturonase PglA n=1 Tax=Amaricoccus sp. TaxID=1872485 RepID=UPI001B5BDA96|nr:glycoside hydrolase family 28 protein [Amaricoccus sp.]MBP7003382.1 glycoside hydrolase family 28 protein [Amaricoccus sp.]
MPAALTIGVSARTPRMVTLRLSGEDVLHFLPEPRRFALETAGATVREGVADRAVLALDGLAPGAAYRLRLDGAAPFDLTTPACAGLVDIAAFGAREDADDNAEAIAAAIAAAPAGGTVLVPTGRWQSTPVFLRSGLTLHLAEGAVLAAHPDRARFPILPARRPDGRMLGTWEGLPAASYAALVNAIDARAVAIAGSGTIDGGGDRGDWWTWPKETRDGTRRPRTIFLSGCEDVTLAGVTVTNSPSWTVHPVACRLLVASALAIVNDPDSPNTDGLDPESCEDVLIEGLRFSVGDDCIAIKAGKRGDDGAGDHLAPTRRVTIRHCLMERGHGGVVIGSEMSGSVTDVSVTACDFRRTDRGLRIKTRRGRGGEIARVVVSGCRMDAVDTGFEANAFYFCDHDGRSERVQSRAPADVDVSTPRLRDITIRDVELRGVRLAAGVFLGLPEAPITGLTLGGIAASFDPEAVAAVPVMACCVPPMRHAGLCAEYAEITLAGAVAPPELAVIRGIS